MSAFDHLDRLASRASDRLNAELFSHEPMLRVPNGRSLVDHTRERVDGRGIFSERAVPVGLQVGDRRQDSRANDFRTIANGARTELSIDRATNPSVVAKQGDEVVLIARGRRFVVASVRPDGAARVVLQLLETQP